MNDFIIELLSDIINKSKDKNIKEKLEKIKSSFGNKELSQKELMEMLSSILSELKNEVNNKEFNEAFISGMLLQFLAEDPFTESFLETIDEIAQDLDNDTDFETKEEIENECVELLEEIRSVFKKPCLLNIQQLDKNVRTLITKECVKSFIEEANFKRKNNQEFQNIFIKYKDIKMHINLTSSSNIGISINILKDSILEFSYHGEDYDLILKIEKRNQGDLSR